MFERARGGYYESASAWYKSVALLVVLGLLGTACGPPQVQSQSQLNEYNRTAIVQTVDAAASLTAMSQAGTPVPVNTEMQEPIIPAATPTWAWQPQIDPTQAYEARRNSILSKSDDINNQAEIEARMPSFYPDVIFNLIMEGKGFLQSKQGNCTGTATDKVYVQMNKNGTIVEYAILRVLTAGHCPETYYPDQIEKRDKLKVKTVRESKNDSNFREFADVIPLTWKNMTKADGSLSKIAELTFAIEVSKLSDRTWTNVPYDAFDGTRVLAQFDKLVGVGFADFTEDRPFYNENIVAGYQNGDVLISDSEMHIGASGEPEIMSDGSGKIVAIFEGLKGDSTDWNLASKIPDNLTTQLQNPSWLTEAKNMLGNFAGLVPID